MDSILADARSVTIAVTQQFVYLSICPLRNVSYLHKISSLNWIKVINILLLNFFQRTHTFLQLPILEGIKPDSTKLNQIRKSKK